MGGLELSFVFPFYDKGAELPKLKELLLALHASSLPTAKEFVIVDDGSHENDARALDATVAELAPHLPLRLVRHERNRGKGAALVTGSREAAGRTLVWCDADAAFRAEDVIALATEALERSEAVVVANRIGATAHRQSLLRKFSSDVFRQSCRAVLNVPCQDIQAGLKAVPSAWFRARQWHNRGFALDVELLRSARAEGVEIREVAVKNVDYSGASSVRLVRTAWQLLRELSGPLGRLEFLVGLLMILVANLRAFSSRSGVPWDARDEMFFYFRWLGAAAREGRLGDWIPNIVSGYPLGANPQSGTYNPLYWLFYAGFPDSMLGVNLLYVFLQLAIFAAVFVLFYCFRFSLLVCLVGGLSVVANGFVTGHASHFSYLSTYLAWIVTFLGLAFATRSHTLLAALCLCLGVFHMLTAGYPGLWVSGFQVFAIVFLFLACKKQISWRAVFALGVGGILGLALGSPALRHFTNQLSLWPRREGLSVDEVLGNALPKASFWNFFVPYLDMGKIAGRVDFTMDRFHATLTITLALAAGLLGLLRAGRSRSQRGLFLAIFGFGCLLAVLASGDNWGFPLKRFLAEHVFLHRVSRFPSGEFRGFALLALSLAACWALEELVPKLRRNKIWLRAFCLFVAVDFFAVMGATIGLRYMRLPEDMQGRLARFQVVYGPEDQPKIDAPRGCPFDARYEFDQRQTPPDRFSWNGYTNLYPQAYSDERESLRWALCGPSRLWDDSARKAHAYKLILYSPGEIVFETQGAAGGSRLLWADVNDGFWSLEIDGRPAAFEAGPASLRYFSLPEAHTARVRMTYKGPLSRLWR